MERNPLIVVSSRLDGVMDKVAQSEKSSSSLVTTWKRAKEADVGNTIVDCHDASVANTIKGEGAYSVTTDLSEVGPNHNYKPQFRPWCCPCPRRCSSIVCDFQL